jgi:Fe-S cluster biogenesis protein NfuA
MDNLEPSLTAPVPVNDDTVFINLDFTPDPNTLKYVLSCNIMERGARNFTNQAETLGVSKLAEKFFDISGIASIMIGTNFVKVTKSDTADWEDVHEKSKHLLETYLNQKLPVFEATGAGLATQENAESTETEDKIKAILDAEIRPAVAMDGGDIVFDRFEQGIVYLYMQGSCVGCPSSTMTLKGFIQKRLQELIPEVLDVVAI